VYLDESKLSMLAGWEQVASSYETAGVKNVESAPNLDVIV